MIASTYFSSLTNYNSRNLRHSYHILPSSPWPLVTSMGLLSLAISTVFYMHGIYFLIPPFCWMTSCLWFLMLILGYWWYDVVKESTFFLQHTIQVMHGIRLGMILFIVSEAMFFFAFFWAFFHSSLSPAMGIGFVWPPHGIDVINPWKLPLLNTMILLTSGAFITCAHNGLLAYGNSVHIAKILYITGGLGVFFLFCQKYEYQHATFSIADGIYGSLFYMTTGFHGLHVLVGTIFIFICAFRAGLNHFDRKYHVGLECAIWYWHFVDIVWLLLYLIVYIWGSS